jgi:hypothetical protein
MFRCSGKVTRIYIKITAAISILLGVYIAVVTFSAQYRMQDELDDFDHMPELRSLFSQGKYEQAYQLGKDLQQTNWNNNAGELEAIVRISDKERSSWGMNGVKFLRGFFAGSGNSSADAAGAIISDLFIYGDVRDILIQSGLAVTGKKADKKLLALSGAGLLLEALPVANWFPAALKYLHKSGSLTAEFSNHLAKSLKKLKSGKSLSKAEKGVFLKLYTLFSRCGFYRTGEIMKFVKTPEQLANAGKFASASPQELTLAVKATKGEILNIAPESNFAKIFAASRKGTAGLFTLKRHNLFSAVKIISSGRAAVFIRRCVQENAKTQWIFYTVSLILIAAGTTALWKNRQKKAEKNQN